MTAKPLPEPRPGLVIRYAYLWRSEAEVGRQESKDRPCAVVVTIRTEGKHTIVYIAPITHTPPRHAEDALEIPAETKRRLGLDEARSWIITTELNRFTWPGPDVRPVGRAGADGFAYGFLPGNMTAALVQSIRERAREGRTRTVDRDEPA